MNAQDARLKTLKMQTDSTKPNIYKTYTSRVICIWHSKDSKGHMVARIVCTLPVNKGGCMLCKYCSQFISACRPDLRYKPTLPLAPPAESPFALVVEIRQTPSSPRHRETRVSSLPLTSGFLWHHSWSATLFPLGKRAYKNTCNNLSVITAVSGNALHRSQIKFLTVYWN